MTEGRFGVTDVVALAGLREEEILACAGIEAQSEHPIAQAMVSVAEERGIKPKSSGPS